MRKKLFKLFLVLILCMAMVGSPFTFSIPGGEGQNVLAAETIANEDFLNAELKTGDVFREYHWGGPYVNADQWQRVTDPNVKRADAREFLPNPINKITIDDLKGAIRVEMVMELWGGHTGTVDKKVKINGNEWIPIPIADNIGPANEADYVQFRYPAIPIPLEQVKEGENTFEFTCKSTGWGQFTYNWAFIRVYYASEKKGFDAKTVVLDNQTDSQVKFGIRTSLPYSKIKKVDYIGLYEDYDYDGNGIYKEWVYNFKHGQMKQNIGTSTRAPFTVSWDTTWIPDQEPIKVMARVTDINNISYLTPVVSGVQIKHAKTTVKMYKAANVPQNFSVRQDGKKTCKTDITDDLTTAKSARMEVATWNGIFTAEVGINQKKISGSLGENHNVSYNSIEVPLSYLIKGTNFWYIYSKTTTHGAEFSWPGMALKVQYDKTK